MDEIEEFEVMGGAPFVGVVLGEWARFDSLLECVAVIVLMVVSLV